MEDSLNEISSIYPDFRVLRIIKTGKEATVYLCRTGNKLMALKQFKEHNKYSTRIGYMNMGGMKGRERRAIMNKTNKGTQLTRNIWTYTEYSTLSLLYSMGADVVEPFTFTSSSLLMEYAGDLESPAPRLAEVSLGKEEAYRLYSLIIKNISIFLNAGLVHGDLSKFNILYHRGKIYIIDFPQVLKIKENRNAREKLANDLENMRSYFSQFIDEEYINGGISYIYREHANIIY